MEKFDEAQALEKLQGFLHRISPLPERFYDRLQGMAKLEQHPKNTKLLRAGEVSRRIFFVMKGLARAWYEDAKGVQRTLWFMKENDLMMSVHSFLTGLPSQENIVLCEDSVLLSITRRQLDALYHEFLEFNLHGRELTQNYYIRSEERSLLLRIPTIAERYYKLLHDEPALFQRVPLTIIASYLGTTKETLSRVRSIKNVDARQFAN